MRAKSSEQLIAAADAIRAGGVRIIEVTMTTPGALKVIEAAKQKYGEEVLFGAGSVLDAETARAAILAGAGFIVAPTLNSRWSSCAGATASRSCRAATPPPRS